MDMQQTIILETASELLKRAGYSVSVTWADGAPIQRLSLKSDIDLSILIGREGQNLSALEHLVKVLAVKKIAAGRVLADFMLDINDYRKSQTDKLIGVAKESAKRVIDTGRAESLLPMNAFERKVVHTELASYERIETQSIGAEPNRRIVIKRISF